MKVEKLRPCPVCGITEDEYNPHAELKCVEGLVAQVKRLKPALAAAEKERDELKKEVARQHGDPFTCGHEPQYAGAACAVCHVHALDALETIEKATTAAQDPLGMSVNSIARRGQKQGGGPCRVVRHKEELEARVQQLHDYIVAARLPIPAPACTLAPPSAARAEDGGEHGGGA